MLFSPPLGGFRPAPRSPEATGPHVCDWRNERQSRPESRGCVSVCGEQGLIWLGWRPQLGESEVPGCAPVSPVHVRRGLRAEGRRARPRRRQRTPPGTGTRNPPRALRISVISHRMNEGCCWPRRSRMRPAGLAPSMSSGSASEPGRRVDSRPGCYCIRGSLASLDFLHAIQSPGRKSACSHWILEIPGHLVCRIGHQW